jgi:GNAT superfamily N-acetyltransferase
VSRRVARLTVDSLAALPEEMRACVAWELDPVERARAEREGTTAEEKAAWLSRVLLEWGSCGRVVWVDDVVAGAVLYAPPGYLPGTVVMPTAPVAEDAVQIASAFVAEEHAGAGLGRLLMQLAVKDVLQRGGYRAVECFGREPGVPPDADACCLPVEFLQRVGFRTARGHVRHPRMRLDLRSVVSWREGAELAWERLLGAVRPPVPAPVPRTTTHRTSTPRAVGGGAAQPPSVEAWRSPRRSAMRSTPVWWSESGSR